MVKIRDTFTTTRPLPRRRHERRRRIPRESDRGRAYGPEIRGAAMRVLNHLLEAATRPHRGLASFSPCMVQADLRPVAFPERCSISDNLMDDVMTCAFIHAGEFVEGSALYRSPKYGYWLADRGVQEEMKQVLGTMKSLATKGERCITQFEATGNGAFAQESGKDVRRALDMVIYPLIERMEDMMVPAQ